MFVCRAGIPDGVLPTVALSMVVFADGKELYRSEPRTSMDDPANLLLILSGAKTLTLKIESAGNVALPAAALWGDPMLVK
jgi:hypothetical protein